MFTDTHGWLVLGRISIVIEGMGGGRNIHTGMYIHTYIHTSVGLGGVGEGVNGALVEEEPEHAADVTAAGVVSALLRGGEDSLHHALRQGLQLLVRSGTLEDLQGLRRSYTRGGEGGGAQTVVVTTRRVNAGKQWVGQISRRMQQQQQPYNRSTHMSIHTP